MQMSRNNQKKRILPYIFSVLIFFSGLAVYLYPIINRSVTSSNITHTLETFRFTRSVYTGAEDAPITDSSGEVVQTEAQRDAASLTDEQRKWYNPDDIRILREAMEDYNQKIYDNKQVGLKDAWSYEEAAFDLSKYGVYDNVIAELRIPAMYCDLPLYLGATWGNMAYGAVQLGQTSMPIGGKNTNCVIAGHRGCTNGAYFLYIENLVIGDRVYVDNLWETLTYRVTDIKIISPDDREDILIQEGKDMLTLITCHPYPFNYQRYAVFCERCANDEIVDEEPAATGEPNETKETEAETEAAETENNNTNPTVAGQTEVYEVTRVTEKGGTSDLFIKIENILVYVVPIIIVLLALIPIFISLKKRRDK